MYVNRITPGNTYSFEVIEAQVGQRLDLCITNVLNTDVVHGYSRSFFKHLIDDGHVSVNGQVKKLVTWFVYTTKSLFLFQNFLMPKCLLKHLNNNFVYGLLPVNLIF